MNLKTIMKISEKVTYFMTSSTLMLYGEVLNSEKVIKD